MNLINFDDLTCHAITPRRQWYNHYHHHHYPIFVDASYLKQKYHKFLLEKTCNLDGETKQKCPCFNKSIEINENCLKKARILNQKMMKNFFSSEKQPSPISRTSGLGFCAPRWERASGFKKDETRIVPRSRPHRVSSSWLRASNNRATSGSWRKSWRRAGSRPGWGRAPSFCVRWSGEGSDSSGLRMDKLWSQ